MENLIGSVDIKKLKLHNKKDLTTLYGQNYQHEALKFIPKENFSIG